MDPNFFNVTLGGIVGSGLATAVFGLLALRHSKTLEAQIKGHFDERPRIFKSKRTWKQQAPSELFGPLYMQKKLVTIEETFAKLVELAKSLDAEQQRAVKEGLSKDELALFDMLVRDDISKADRDRLKEASRGLLESMEALVKLMERWTEKEQTQAEVKVFILDHLFAKLPDPPYSPKETEQAATREPKDKAEKDNATPSIFKVVEALTKSIEIPNPF